MTKKVEMTTEILSQFNQEDLEHDQNHNFENHHNNDDGGSNEFALHLKPVFDACDYNGDGFVKVQDLIDLGKQHSVGNGGDVSHFI